ncbi:MAG: hypothetical protein M0Z99_33895 [Betaproteobacteria bacterium]|nr:hypothetical protein [Betaproteobacteria bacterium]
MNRVKFSGASVALNATGLASAVAYSGGGYALSATTPGDSLGHIITIAGKAATNHSAKTFTVTGTDADGAPQSEGIAGPNGVATVSTTKYFKTVTSVTVSSTTNADTFDIGWTAASVTPWEFLKEQLGPNGFGFACIVDAGTPTFGVEQQYGSGDGIAHATVAAKSANIASSITSPVAAVRLAFTAAGTVSLWGLY